MSTETVVDVVMGIQVDRQGLTVVVVGAEEGGIITLREKMEMEIGEITIPELEMEVGEASLVVKRVAVQAVGVATLEVVVGETILVVKRAARMLVGVAVLVVMAVVGETSLPVKRVMKIVVGETSLVVIRAAVAGGEGS